MRAAIIVRANVPHLLALLTQDPVHQGRLAHSRRAKQDRGLSRSEIRVERVESAALRRRDDVHGHERRHPFNFRDSVRPFVAEVGLRQEQNRPRPALPDER